ncbi:MAG: hypothetical protein Q7R50_06590 [Dehalococcoidales bacterium]|nr:hypothetical protein [Dehalococcoidales bacterium]
MEIVEVLQESEQGMPDISGLIRPPEWLIRLMHDMSSVMEAIAAHDNRLDV